MSKPSPALVISILALFVALGGTGYAAVKLNGKNIKKGTVSGTALKKNTLTGKQINEAKLGKVPSAVAADSAADSARLGGLGADSFAKGNAQVLTHNVSAPQSGEATLIEIPGLARLSGTCTASNLFGLTFRSLADGVTFRLVTTYGPTVASPGSTTFDKDEFVNVPYYSSPKFELSIWRVADPDVAYEVSGAAVGCKASAVAVGHG
ncbi:MAG: hypothetical protein ACSLFF_00975 [Solirubrobacterales bacterium]